MKTIKKSITINAPKDKVWAVLLEDNYTQDWYSIFCPGTTAESDWIEGHKIIFKNNENSGMVGIVATKRPYEQLTFEFTGMYVNGVEDYTSADAQLTKGTKESYNLNAVSDNQTILSIESDMSDEYYEKMSEVWEQALKRIDELSHAI